WIKECCVFIFDCNISIHGSCTGGFNKKSFKKYLVTVFFCPIFTFLFGWSSYCSTVNPFFHFKIYILCRFLIFFKEKKQAGQRYLIFAFSANIFRFVNLAPICQSTILSDRTPQSGHLIAFDILVASGMVGSPIALYSK